MSTLLMVEDDAAIREMLQTFLDSKGYRVNQAESGEAALEQLAESTPDLLLLDWMLPDLDGIEIIRRVRQREHLSDLPIIMLTAKAEEIDKVKGLDIGADDYMTKPVSLKELDARIRSLLRRSHGLNEEGELKIGAIELNPATHQLRISGEPISVALTEFRLLYFLMKRRGRVFSRLQLLDGVWGEGAVVDERTVDVHILRLRKLLKPHGEDGMVETVRGLGYRFADRTI
jgi:two-component system, OmpR family, phosphate regulon response regulator PhoB